MCFRPKKTSTNVAFRPQKRQPICYSDPNKDNQCVIQTTKTSTNVLFRPKNVNQGVVQTPNRQQMCYSDPKTCFDNYLYISLLSIASFQVVIIFITSINGLDLYALCITICFAKLDKRLELTTVRYSIHNQKNLLFRKVCCNT